MVVNSEADIIALEFGEIFRTLEMKKQQLIEDLENQRSKKEKEFQIWKKMKETHKKTIENFLKDCEKLVHECDPQRFLEVVALLLLLELYCEALMSYRAWYFIQCDNEWIVKNKFNKWKNKT